MANDGIEIDENLRAEKIVQFSFPDRVSPHQPLQRSRLVRREVIGCERLQPTNEFWIGFAPHSKFNAADEDCLKPVDPAG